MKTERFIIFKNTTVFYRISGSGKVVVLIHGFGEDGNIWNYLADKLKEGFRVIVPELPGSGRSGILRNEDVQIFIDDYAEVIFNIIKNESIEACTVIGHSMGGYIALAIAEKYPGILSGFGLFNSTAFADTEEKKKERLKSVAFLQNNDGASFLKTSIPGLFAEKFKQEHPEDIEALIDSVKYLTSEALMQYHLAMIARPERITVLKTTTLPVLFIIGEEDPAIPLQTALKQCHLPYISHIHLLPGVGHMGMLEEKELCAEIVLSYLANLNVKITS